MGTKVLVADDDAVTRHLLKKLLSGWGYQVIAVDDGASALRELESPGAPALAIVDWMMPGFNGPEVVRRIRNTRPDSYVYVLLLTARNDKSDLLLGLDSGADDFLTKPVDAQELRARLRVGERIMNLQSKLADALRVSQFRAGHDALTGLYNRRMILNLLEREKAKYSLEGGAVGLVLADIDYFKSVNDTYGHSVGDEVLLEVAGRMLSGLRPYDLLGRCGGEEFLIVASGCGPDAVQAVAERVRSAVAKSPIHIGNVTLDVTISLGSTVLSLSDQTSSSLNRADLALYESKHAGRNTCRFRPGPPDEGTPGSQFLLPAESVPLAGATH